MRLVLSIVCLDLVLFGLTFDHAREMPQDAFKAAVVLALLVIAWRGRGEA
jgi:hypothetical protein